MLSPPPNLVANTAVLVSSDWSPREGTFYSFFCDAVAVTIALVLFCSVYIRLREFCALNHLRVVQSPKIADLLLERRPGRPLRVELPPDGGHVGRVARLHRRAELLQAPHLKLKQFLGTKYEYMKLNAHLRCIPVLSMFSYPLQEGQLVHILFPVAFGLLLLRLLLHLLIVRGHGRRRNDYVGVCGHRRGRRRFRLLLWHGRGERRLPEPLLVRRLKENLYILVLF